MSIEWISLLVAPITGVITWVAGRKFKDLEYADKSVDVIARLQSQNSDLLKHIEELEDRIVELNRQLSEAKTSMLQLQSSFNEYKRTADMRIAELCTPKNK